jgi:hypothetical protein
MYQPKTYHKPLLILLLVFGCSRIARAQRTDSATYDAHKIYYWGGFHFGAGSYFINCGLDVVAVKTDINGNVSILAPPTPTLEADESDLMFGIKLTHHRFSNWILLSGISYIWMKDRGDVIGNNPGLFGGNVYGDAKTYHGAGVPVMLKYTVTPAPMFAMDFSAGMNINSYRNFFAITFGLAFGRVRGGDAHPARDIGDIPAVRPSKRLRRPFF